MGAKKIADPQVAAKGELPGLASRLVPLGIVGAVGVLIAGIIGRAHRSLRLAEDPRIYGATCPEVLPKMPKLLKQSPVPMPSETAGAWPS